MGLTPFWSPPPAASRWIALLVTSVLVSRERAGGCRLVWTLWGSHHAAVLMSSGQRSRVGLMRSFAFDPSGSGRVCVPIKPLITHCRTSALLWSALHRLKIIHAEVGAFYQSGILGLGPNTGAGAQHSLLSTNQRLFRFWASRRFLVLMLSLWAAVCHESIITVDRMHYTSSYEAKWCSLFDTDMHLSALADWFSVLQCIVGELKPVLSLCAGGAAVTSVGVSCFACVTWPPGSISAWWTIKGCC